MTNSFSISQRLLVTEIMNPEGTPLTVLTGHFHHDPKIRTSQWRTVRRLASRHLPNLILLADHNSVLVPGCDTFLPPNPKELPNIVRSREVETEALAALGIVDSWTEIHED